MDLSVLAEQITHQDTIEWVGLFTGILYVILAAYEKPLCWIFGIVSCACIAWKSYTDYKLMADVGLQTFYVVIGFLGLWNWMKAGKEDGTKPIITMIWVKHVIVIVIILIISYPISWLLIHYADARYGYPDTSLTLLSVWATILLVRKDLHNWVYWIFIDVMYTGLYWRSEGYLFALLYLFYAGISVWGWRKWRNAALPLNPLKGT
ncbi:MAG: nicotinamide riboside transporter PnuC [Saprospiraceae bacterium]